MANNNETTTKFKVDISELKKAMQDAKRQISVANSEFKAASSTMDNWAQSTDGISAKLKQLDSNLKNQKTILSSLEQQYEAVVAEQGEGSAAADRLKIAINNQKATISQTEKQISNYNTELVKVAKAEGEAATSGKSVAEVLEDVGNEAESAGDGFTTLKGTIATFAGNMLTSFVGAVKEGITSLAGLADETREYRTELAKLETGATQAGASADYIKDKWQDMGAVLGDEGAVTEGLNNLLAAGFTTEKEMDAITQHLEGAAIKWKDTLKFEGLADGLQETLATGAAVGSFGEMLERSGVNLEEFNAGLAECTTEADKQNYILSQLSGLGLAEVSKAYREQNKDLIAANRANSDFNDTVAQMGAKLEPVTTAVKNGFNGLLQELVKLTGDIDMEAFTSKINSAFTVLKDDVLPAVKNGFKWIIDNKDILIAGLAGIAAGFAAFKVASLITAVTTALQGMSVATALAAAKQWLLNTALLANPIVLIVTLIVGLIAAIVAFIASNEDARKKIGEVWDKVKEKISGFVDSVKTFFTETIPAVFKSLIEWIKKNWTTILVFLTNPFAGLFKYFYENNGKFKEFVDNAIKFIKQLPSKVWDWLVKTITKITEWRLNMIKKAAEVASDFVKKVIEFFKDLPTKIGTWLLKVISKIADWGSDLAQKGKDAATKLLNSVVNNIKNLPDKIKSVGADIVTGLWNGINNKFSWLTGKIKSFASSVTNKLKDFFGIHSPSRVMANEVGKWLPEGIAVGIDKNAKSAINAMRDLTVNTVGAARAGLNSASSGVTGGTVNNFYQTINSPKQLNRLDIYRQSKNLLGYAGGGF